MILCGLLWSTGGFIIKLIPWSPMAIAGIRSGLAAIIIILYDNPKKFNFSFTTWAGAICYSIMVLCFVSANKMTTAGNVILIQFTAPVYVALIGFYFLGEKSTKLDWLTILIILSGLFLFFLDEITFDQLWGKILALISGFGFAGLTLMMRKQKKERPIDSALIGNILTFFICIPYYSDGATFEVQSWLLIFFLGLFQLGIPYVLYSTAIRYVSALDAIIYPAVEPICSPLFAHLILNESMPLSAKVGGALVLIGVIGRGVIKNTGRDKLC